MRRKHPKTSIKFYQGAAIPAWGTILKSPRSLAGRRFTRSVLVACLCILSVSTFGVGSVDAQIFPYHDSFDDGDVTELTPGGFWKIEDGSPEGSTISAESGDLFMSGNSFFLVELLSVDGELVEPRSEWSFRGRVIFHAGTFLGMGTKARNHAALYQTALRAGTLGNFVITTLPYPYFGEELLIQMDAFDGQITGSVWKEGDLASLVQTSTLYSPQSTIPGFGITGRATILETWIDTSPLPIPMLPHGDTDSDGDVDTDDLNNVRNDFGCRRDCFGDTYPFDGVVNIDDLNAVRNNFGAGVEPVPEPSTLVLASIAALIGFVPWRRVWR